MFSKLMFSFIALFLISLFAPTASAQSFRAIVIDDAPGGCGAIGIDENAVGGAIPPPYVLVSSETGKHITATVKGGKLILTCKVKNVPNTTGRAVTDMVQRIYEEYGVMLPCITRFYDQRLVTFDSHSTLSASGVAIDTCIFDLEE